MGEEEAVPEEVILTMTTLDTTPVKAVHIAQWTNRDPVLSRVREFVRHGWPTEVKGTAYQPYTTRRLELSVIYGCLLWGSRVVIPPKGQETTRGASGNFTYEIIRKKLCLVAWKGRCH